jgi:hypothetical protein
MGISTYSREFDVTKGASRYNDLKLPKRRGGTMTSALENSNAGTQRTRRNIMDQRHFGSRDVSEGSFGCC